MIILSTLVVSTLGARISDHGTRTVKNGDNGHLSLSKFGFDQQKLEYYRRRAMVLNAGGINRLPPSGPDPQHHLITSPALS